MSSNLNSPENSVVRKLIHLGLDKAALALGQILNTSVEVSNVLWDTESTNGLPHYSDKPGSKTHLIKTQVIGDLKGVSHLILSKSEVEKIHQKCLPASILEQNSPESRLMKLEFLTEVDNIAAASLITQFANHLNVQIHGHVPSVHVMKGEEVNKYIYGESVVLDAKHYFNATLRIPEIDIEPQFVWLFQGELLDRANAALANGGLKL